MKSFFSFNLKITLLGLLLVSLFLGGCASSNKKENAKTDAKTTKQKEGNPPAWLQTLPDYTLSNIEHSDDKYSYKYSEIAINDNKINRSLDYNKNKDNKYLGTISLNFSNPVDSFIENIPKSFASHVDKLIFSK